MPALTRDIARRYLFGKKSTNSINIITGISIFGISIGTAALVLILSVFNGFEGLLSSLFNAFNPDLKVTPVEGKYFKIKDEQLLALQELPNVVAAAKTVEEIALFEYNGNQELGKIKGINNNFLSGPNHLGTANPLAGRSSVRASFSSGIAGVPICMMANAGL